MTTVAEERVYCTCDEGPGEDGCPVHDQEDADLENICDVCCRPWAVEVERDADGDLYARVERAD